MSASGIWASVIIGVIISIPSLIYLLALNDILWTTVREGTAKAIMKGESFVTFFMSVEGYRLNDPNKESHDDSYPEWEIIPGKDEKPWLARVLGVYWIGWIWPFRQVHTYTFEWAEPTQKEDGTYEPWHRDELTDFIYVIAFQYFVLLRGAETKGNLPVDVVYLLTVRITNPYKALFGVENWLERVTAATNRAARSYTGMKEFEEIRSEFDEEGRKKSDLFSHEIVKLNKKLPDRKSGRGLPCEYGIEVLAADPQTIDLSGTAGEELRKATTAEYVAEQNAKATVKEANGTAEAITIVAEAEKGRIETVYGAVQAHGPTGVRIRQLEAVENAAKDGDKTVIWGNNPLEPLNRLFGDTDDERRPS